VSNLNFSEFNFELTFYKWEYELFFKYNINDMIYQDEFYIFHIEKVIKFMYKNQNQNNFGLHNSGLPEIWRFSLNCLIIISIVYKSR
jgi:hypothetical protein